MENKKVGTMEQEEYEQKDEQEEENEEIKCQSLKYVLKKIYSEMNDEKDISSQSENNFIRSQREKLKNVLNKLLYEGVIKELLQTNIGNNREVYMIPEEGIECIKLLLGFSKEYENEIELITKGRFQEASLESKINLKRHLRKLFSNCNQEINFKIAKDYNLKYFSYCNDAYELYNTIESEIEKIFGNWLSDEEFYRSIYKMMSMFLEVYNMKMELVHFKNFVPAKISAALSELRM